MCVYIYTVYMYIVVSAMFSKLLQLFPVKQPSLLWWIWLQGPGLPFGFYLDCWLVSFAPYPQRLHISAMLKSQNKVLKLKSVVSVQLNGYVCT